MVKSGGHGRGGRARWNGYIFAAPSFTFCFSVEFLDLKPFLLGVNLAPQTEEEGERKNQAKLARISEFVENRQC